MARCYMPALAVRAAGAVNDVVFSYMDATWDGGIQTVRVKPMQVYNPNTAAQQAVREAFTAAVRFWKEAVDNTIGGASFVRANFDAVWEALEQLKQYKGVAEDGRQLFIGAAVGDRVGSPAPTPLLPQDCTLEAEITAILVWAEQLEDYCGEFMTQAFRLGFQS